MGTGIWAIVVVGCFHIAELTDPPCVMELQCAECVPDNMPAVTSHRVSPAGAVSVPAGDEVRLSCAPGHFLRYPRPAVTAVCEAGRYRVRHDAQLRHLLDLGCQENIYEDVMHQVSHCVSPLQGRAYQTQEPSGAGTRHLAALCYDADRALAVRALVSSAPRDPLALAPHAEQRAPLTLLGNFNHMFDARTRADAERLYGDEASLARRLREQLRPDGVALAGQALAAAGLLAAEYFEGQGARAAAFPSNRVAAWASVARGNLRHVQRDVAALLAGARAAGRVLHVHAGTHGVAAVRTGGGGRRELYLKPDRFPVPRYVWTVAHDVARARALAVVVLNDPFVAVSEIREAVFCESTCGEVRWLREATAARRYEAPLYGLVFCCDVHAFAARVPEMPRDVVRDVPRGKEGMLVDIN